MTRLFTLKLLEADSFELFMRFPRSSLDVRQVQTADHEPCSGMLFGSKVFAL
jgi:hypothetical protein